MKVWMFVFNNCKYDARVLREAKTLAEDGHDVKIAAILDQDTEPAEERDGFRIIRVNRLPIDVSAAHNEGKHISPDNNTTAILFRLFYQPLRRRIHLAYFWAKNNLHGLLRIPLIVIYRSLSFFKYYRNSWELVRKEPADVYHCHDLDTLFLGYIAKRRHGGKLVYDVHELTTELAYIPHYEKPVWRVLEQFMIKRADAVIATGRYREEYLSKKYGIPSPTEILNCPLVSSEPYPDNSLRKELGLLDSSVPIILYAGGYSHGRGLQNLVRAVPYLTRGVVVLMGWGALEQKLRNMVREKGLERKVLFLKPVPPDKLVRYIASATLGVVIYQFTSLNNYYATPNKLYEYINAGLPVVSSNFPALKEIIEGYEFGKTFDPEEPQSIAAAINWILADEQRYTRMRKKALEAASTFTWEREAIKLRELYQGLSQ
ncbi:glycosyltransferase family 4 protein [Chloroflexota bacterium]